MSTEHWADKIPHSAINAEQVSGLSGISPEDISQVIKTYPMKINPYYLSQIKLPGDPFWKQAIPDIRELESGSLSPDPLCENEQSPEQYLIARYPDRVILIVTRDCFMYCRFCMRKRSIGYQEPITEVDLAPAILYIEKNKAIKDVILSGGDPLMLSDHKLETLLKRIRNIRHVETIRIHSRAVCTYPERITDTLCSILNKYHPVYMNTHINHPAEITPEVIQAAEKINSAGIPLGCQTVLLKGVNDDSDILRNLFRKLVKYRIRPYYLHHPDLVSGTSHFRCRIKDGLSLMKTIRGHISGICIPHYVLDLPGGGGKIPLVPDYIRETEEDGLIIESFNGKLYRYPD